MYDVIQHANLYSVLDFSDISKRLAHSFALATAIVSSTSLSFFEDFFLKAITKLN